MNCKTVASNDPYCLSTDDTRCLSKRYWVVILDNGLTIFESEPRIDLSPANPWLRLKQLCEDMQTRILGMAYVDPNNPNNQLNLDNNADGYYYSRMIYQSLNLGPQFQGEAEGVGYLHGDILTIHWYFLDGKIEVEHRDLSKQHPKVKNLSLIRNVTV
jgi:hypothetical protein